jgi:hypothetical protein
MAQDYRTLKLEVLAETKQFVAGMNNANKETQTFGDKLGDFGKKAAAAFAVVGAAAGAMAVKIGKEAIAAASDLAETTSKVSVIFETASKDIEDFAETAAASLGQTRTQAMNAAATFATFGKSAGLTGKELSGFSIEFVKLASDLASFNNTDIDQAINALGAALRGESEPIRAYGVLLNDATLKAKAMEMGLYSGKGALDAQTKVLAAHKVILDQTRDAQGDFARTADGLANSQRILSARIEETKIILGEALLPIALAVTKFFNETMVPVLEKVAGLFSGGEGAGITDKVKELVTQIGDFLMPIIDALKGAFDRVSEAITSNKGNFEALATALKNIYDFSMTYLIPIIKDNLVNAITGIGIAFSTVLKVVTPIIGTISKLISGIVTVVDNAVKAIIKLVNIAIDAVNKVIAAYNKIPGLPNINPISKVGVPSGSNTVPESSRPSINLPGFSGSGKPEPDAMVEPDNKPAKPDEGQKPEDIKLPNKDGVFDPGRFRQAEERLGKVIDGVFDPGSFRRGEEKDRVTINVSGAIDPQSTARQIAEILNSEAAVSGSFRSLGINRFSTRAE